MRGLRVAERLLNAVEGFRVTGAWRRSTAVCRLPVYMRIWRRLMWGGCVQIKNMKEYIARFGHGSAKLARQAQSKEKTLAKMVAEGLTEKVAKESSVQIKFENVGKLPPPVLQVRAPAAAAAHRAAAAVSPATSPAVSYGSTASCWRCRGDTICSGMICPGLAVTCAPVSGRLSPVLSCSLRKVFATAV